MVFSISVDGKVKVFVKRAGKRPLGFLISTVYDTPYVHAGLIVDGMIIEVGSNGTNIREFKGEIENAEIIEVNVDITFKEARAIAIESYNHYLTLLDPIKIFLNRNFGFDFETTGVSCSELVARILGQDNPDIFLPEDFVEMKEDKSSLPSWIDMSEWRDDHGQNY